MFAENKQVIYTAPTYTVVWLSSFSLYLFIHCFFFFLIHRSCCYYDHNVKKKWIIFFSFQAGSHKALFMFFSLLLKLSSNLWSLFSVRFSKIHLFDIFLAFHVNPLAFYFILKIKISDYNVSVFFFVLFL